jgi:hypothetical protein
LAISVSGQTKPGRYRRSHRRRDLRHEFNWTNVLYVVDEKNASGD